MWLIQLIFIVYNWLVVRITWVLWWSPEWKTFSLSLLIAFRAFGLLVVLVAIVFKLTQVYVCFQCLFHLELRWRSRTSRIPLWSTIGIWVLIGHSVVSNWAVECTIKYLVWILPTLEVIIGSSSRLLISWYIEIVILIRNSSIHNGMKLLSIDAAKHFLFQ